MSSQKKTQNQQLPNLAIKKPNTNIVWLYGWHEIEALLVFSIP